jgi:drug/metabolite transporter (DMT)-like permease
MTIFLSYIIYFILTTANTLQRRFVIKKKDAPAVEQINFAFEVMIVLVLASIVMQFFSPLYFAGDNLRLIMLSLVCGVFGMGYFILNFIAQKHVDVGVSNILLNISTPIIIILSSLFLNEGLSNIQIGGTALLLVSIFLISKKHRIGRFSFDKYFWFMILSGVSVSVLLVAERALQVQTGLTAATMLSWVSQAFFLGLATLILKSKHTYTHKEVLTTGVLQVCSSMSYVVLLFIVGNLSLISSITTFKIVTVFIGAALFLGEREDMGRKIFGSIVAVIGLLLMK